jgi:hypothetical protein
VREGRKIKNDAQLFLPPSPHFRFFFIMKDLRDEWWEGKGRE